MLVVYAQLDTATRPYFQRMPMDLAPPAYQPRLARKTHPAARAQSMAGLWLLRQGLELSGHTGAAINSIDVDANNRPRLAGGPAFSISHSDHHVACAITDISDGATRAGLDIEEPRTMDAGRMTRLACNDTERSAIRQRPERFFDYWCAREATVKASGRVGLKRIRQIDLAGDRAWLDGRCWFLQPLALAAGLTACLASDSPDECVQVRHLAPPAHS